MGGAVVNENGLLDDILLFLNIFGELEIDECWHGLGKTCFKSFLPSEGIRCFLLW